MHKPNKIKLLLALLASFAALSLVATIAFRIHREGAPAEGVRKLPVQVDVSLRKVHYTETKQGVKRWDLAADRAQYDKETGTTSLAGVRLVVAGTGGTGDLHVTADRAIYQNVTRDVYLAGNVHGQSGSGMEFSTSRVTYVAARSQLETREHVRFCDAGLLLEGVGMEFQTQTRRLKLMSDVSAIYRPRGLM